MTTLSPAFHVTASLRTMVEFPAYAVASNVVQVTGTGLPKTRIFLTSLKEHAQQNI